MTYQKDRKCPKCGMKEASASFTGEGDIMPHMSRYCRYCGYHWTEEPLDEEAPEGEDAAGEGYEERCQIVNDFLEFADKEGGKG